MASIIRNTARGSWQIQWNSGTRWVRQTVLPKRRGWKVGDPMPKKPPGEVTQALIEFQNRENKTRLCRFDSNALTVEEFLQAYKINFETRFKATSARRLKMLIRIFLEFCKVSKVKQLDQVTPEFLDRFLTNRAKTNVASSVKATAGALAPAWARAVELRQLKENPWVGLEIPGMKTKIKRTAWTRDQVDALVKKSKWYMRDVLTLGCNTGLRINALMYLEWRDVVWNGNPRIVVRPELDKTGRGYSVLMSAECHDLLARLLAEREGESPHVLKGSAGQKLHSNPVRTAITRAAKRAGLDVPRSPCHAMRRTLGRWAVLGTLTGRPIPMFVVSKWMGHASVQMTEHYFDLDESTSQNWMAPVEAPPTS